MIVAALLVALAAAPPPCPPLPRGAAEVLKPGGMLILGELHGTKEAPALLAALACAAAKAAPIRVGLELTAVEAARVEDYLASDGSPCDREILLQGPPWSNAFQSGKTSVAMLDLIEALRKLRTRGTRVVVFGFDASGAAREAEMAERVRAARAAAPRETFLLLTGNLHSRTRIGTPWDPAFRPMGHHLAGHRIAFLSLDMALAGGEAWNCRGNQPTDCGARPLEGTDRGAAPFFERHAVPDETGHHGRWYLGRVSASPPAASACAGEGACHASAAPAPPAPAAR